MWRDSWWGGEMPVGRLVTIAISEAAVSRAEELARRTDRRLEDVLADWINRAVVEPPVESLPDEQIRVLCEGQMSGGQQEEPGELLERQREGILDATGCDYLRASSTIHAPLQAGGAGP